MLDANAIAESMFASVSAFLERELAPLRAKIATLETELAARPPAVIHQSMLERTVADAVGAIRKPQDGKDGVNGLNGKDGAAGLNGKDGANGRDGKDCDIGVIRGMVALEVNRAVSERPLPEKGDKGEDGAPGKQGDKGEPGIAGRDGRDGAPGLNGKDGKDGINGKDGLPGANGKDGLAGQDGTAGRDGIDGKDGHAGMEYKGVFKYTTNYERGDCVTWDGSAWVCNEPTTDRPGDGNKAWQLAVRKGRDGKDGNPPPRSNTPFGDK